MIVHRRKKCKKVYKANTKGDSHGKFFAFSYKITFRYPNIAPFVLSLRSKKHACMWHVTGTKSYFENVLHVICRISVEMQRKLVSEFKEFIYKALHCVAGQKG